MKTFFALIFLWTALASAHADSDEVLDRWDDALSYSGADNQVRLHLSGTLDLEEYIFPRPAPGLIYSGSDSLLNPRLTVFLDGQLGSKIYGFLQTRLDRGFDPADGHARLRLDEYALRFTPWEDGRLQIEVGKFGTVVGNWIRRHGSWDDSFVTAPLAYENLTGIWDVQPAPSTATLLQWSRLRYNPYGPSKFDDKDLRVPIIWGPSYNHGISLSGKVGNFEFAGEIKSGALSSRPDDWDSADVDFTYPTFSAEVSYRPSPTWNLGASASSGPYLDAYARGLTPGHGRGDYREIVFGQDFEYAWHHLQIWAEMYEARFENPALKDPSLVAYYVEAKYQFAPRLFGAVRWNQEIFGRIEDAGNARVKWGRDTWQIDVAPTFRFSRHTQIKIQYSLQNGYSHQRSFGHIVSTQLTLRF